MQKNILIIDGGRAGEIRAALVCDGQVEEFECESVHARRLKGEIYLGKISNVENSLHAAFVDYGADKQGFLPFSEIVKGDIFPVYEKDNNGFEETDDKRRARLKNIEPGRKILVQIVKEERGTKGATMTSCISLLGRACVFTPGRHAEAPVSPRVSCESDRSRLRGILDEISRIRDIPDGGIMLRKAAVSMNYEDVSEECFRLKKLWEKILDKSQDFDGPAYLYSDGGVLNRIFRDICDESVSEIIVYGKEAFEVSKNLLRGIMPSSKIKIKSYSGRPSIFAKYRVETQINELRKSVVTLKSGGYVVINQTEALVSVDVNSGKMTVERNPQDTAFKTNQEAVDVIARQLRLRNMSGLIIVDFIDMIDSAHRKIIEREMKNSFRRDRAKTQVGKISQFGLLEITRQRFGSSLLERDTRVCNSCNGLGRVTSPQTNVSIILRDLESIMRNKEKGEAFLVEAKSEEIMLLANEFRAHINELELKYATSIHLDINELQIVPKVSVLGEASEYLIQERPIPVIDDAEEFLRYCLERKKNRMSYNDRRRRTTKKSTVPKWLIRLGSMNGETL